jgi:peptidoglycan/xylan/chitin deacetylase (PgdA/CDA1 family)
MKIKKILERIISFILVYSGFIKLYTKLNKNRLLILKYHRIGDYNKLYKENLSANLKNFEKQLKYLSKNYKIISFNDIDKTQKGNNYVIITFDDGYKDNFTKAYPLLQKYNIKATFFPTTSFLGNKNIPWWEKESKNKEIFMSWKDLKSMKNIEFGSHTLTHPRLSKLNKKQQEKEIKESKKILETKTKQNIITFSYPYGDYNKETIEILKRNNIKYAVTVKEGTNKLNQLNNYELKRVGVSPQINLSEFKTRTSGLLKDIKK